MQTPKTSIRFQKLSERMKLYSLKEDDNSYRTSTSSSLWSKAVSSYSGRTVSHQEHNMFGMQKLEAREELSRSSLEIDPEPDSRLVNWKRWLDIHKEQQDKLSNILKRPPQCLLMNMNFNNLHVNQEKQLITEATDFELCDKQRGHPSFWCTEGGAFNDSPKLGIYRPLQKKYDRSKPIAKVNEYAQPKEMEYVGVPDVIKEEKGLAGDQCLPHPRLKWDMSESVRRKNENLKQKLNLFQEYTPQSEKLAIVGCNIISGESHVINKDFEEAFEESTKNSEETNTSEEHFQSIPNDSIIVLIDDELVENYSSTWTIHFENSITNELYKKCLTIQNLNECCLRYSWDLVLPSFVKSTLPLKYVRNMRPFYFNKNDGVILPKSSEKLCFYLESKRVGVFHEQWKLFLSNAPDKEECITIELQAVVEEKPGIDNKLKLIDSYVDSCTRLSIASKTVKEILERSRPERPSRLPYNWMFFEEQIFLFNNPDLYYENKSVHLLKEMNKRLDMGPWDYSVQTLRKNLSEKALHEDMTETVNEFTTIICSLVKPKLKVSFSQEKYKSVYELVSCFFNMMEKESDRLKSILKIPFKLPIGHSYTDRDSLSIKTSQSTRVSKSQKRKSSSAQKPFRGSQKNTSSSQEITFLKHEPSMLSQTTSLGEPIGGADEEGTKKQEYLDALYIETYHLLCATIDNIGAVIDSFDAQKKKGILLTLKENRTVNKS